MAGSQEVFVEAGEGTEVVLSFFSVQKSSPSPVLFGTELGPRAVLVMVMISSIIISKFSYSPCHL